MITKEKVESALEAVRTFQSCREEVKRQCMFIADNGNNKTSDFEVLYEELDNLFAANEDFKRKMTTEVSEYLAFSQAKKSGLN